MSASAGGSSDFKLRSNSTVSFYSYLDRGLERQLTPPRPHNELVAELDMTSIIQQIYEEFPGTIHARQKECNDQHRQKWFPSLSGCSLEGETDN